MRVFYRAARLLSLMLAVTIVFLTPVFAAEDAEMRLIGFENGTKQGFEGNAGTETLTVTGDEAYGGGKSLFVSGRTETWHGPSLRIEYYITPGLEYTITASVLAKTPDSSQFRLTTQVGQGGSAEYYNLDVKTVSVSDGWTQLSGTFSYPETDYITIYIENDTPDASFYIDDISAISMAGGGPLASLQLPSLHEIYKDYFLLGSAYSLNDLSGTRFELVKRHFNVMTAGNAMKPDALTSAPGSYRYSAADGMLETLEEAGILVHGHTLVWHSQSADWLNKGEGGAVLTRAEAKANMEAYINEVAGHYAGRVISWDVVNEAFQTSVSSVPSDWRTALRKGGGNEGSAWFEAYENGKAEGESGADYIYDAFVFARLADPDAVLYYNDFNETERGKREAIAMMVTELNTQWQTDGRNTRPDRLLIEGIGMQAHYWTDDLNPDTVEETIKRFASTGAEVSITELDIPAGNWSNYKTLTASEEMKQATLYAKLFQIFKLHSDKIARVSIWGIDDPSSWRSGGSPLLFDSNTAAKLAYYAAADPDGFLMGEYNDVKSSPSSGANPEPTTPPNRGGEQSAPPSPGSTAPNAEPTGGGDGDVNDKSIMSYLPFIAGGLGLLGLAGLLIYFLRRNR